MKSLWRWVLGGAMASAVALLAPVVSFSAQDDPGSAVRKHNRGEGARPEARPAKVEGAGERGAAEANRAGRGGGQRLRDRLRDGSCQGPACPLAPPPEQARGRQRGEPSNPPGAIGGGPRGMFGRAQRGWAGGWAGEMAPCPRGPGCRGCAMFCRMAPNAWRGGDRLRLRDGSCMRGYGMGNRARMSPPGPPAPRPETIGPERGMANGPGGPGMHGPGMRGGNPGMGMGPGRGMHGGFGPGGPRS